MKPDTYYQTVADYFDTDASDFEERYEKNPVLKHLREDFRNITERYSFQRALEIGCGPGIDLLYYGKKYPQRTFYAIDVSPQMVELAQQNVRQANLTNVMIRTGSPEALHDLFGVADYDMIYVYFGALNTVYDLQEVARHLHAVTHSHSHLILTFVNRYYFMDIPLFLMKGKFKQAFSRFTNRWRGYSPDKSIPSQCYSSRDIRKAFSSHFTITDRKGYSILYPAWYRHYHLNRLSNQWAARLWQWDSLINRTPFWNSGEYSLYVLQPQ